MIIIFLIARNWPFLAAAASCSAGLAAAAEGLLNVHVRDPTEPRQYLHIKVPSNIIQHIHREGSIHVCVKGVRQPRGLFKNHITHTKGMGVSHEREKGLFYLIFNWKNC